MIEQAHPNSWQDLQKCVGKILEEIGFAVEIEKRISTPRGTIAVDVFAVDVSSVDQITYIIECKNWANPVNQSVIHSFTTVLHETGGNIGLLISKSGLQSGAIEYTKSTNIVGLSFDDFQSRYKKPWFERFFIPTLSEFSDNLIEYTEPINSKREREAKQLSDSKYAHYQILLKRHAPFGALLAMLASLRFKEFSPFKIDPDPQAILDFLNRPEHSEFTFHSNSLRGILAEIESVAYQVTDEFNQVFGRNLFS